MKLLVAATILIIAISSDAFAEPTEIKETEVLENETMTLYTSQEDRVQYYITKPNHPAYPYMIESKVLGRRDGTRFKINGYGTDSDAAKAFIKEIEDINAEKVRKIRGE